MFDCPILAAVALQLSVDGTLDHFCQVQSERFQCPVISILIIDSYIRMQNWFYPSLIQRHGHSKHPTLNTLSLETLQWFQFTEHRYSDPELFTVQYKEVQDWICRSQNLCENSCKWSPHLDDRNIFCSRSIYILLLGWILFLTFCMFYSSNQFNFKSHRGLK